MQTIRKGTLHKAINPATGKIIGTEGAKIRAWTAFARFVRMRDPYCYTCGNPTTEAGHFLHNSDKRNKKLGGNELWYDERNVHGQCGTCNRHHGGRGSIYSVRLIEQFGEGIISELYGRFNKGKKWTIEEILQVADKYEKLNKQATK